MKPTTALRKIAALKERVWIVQGGQGAGKTISILMILIDYARAVADLRIFIISAELSKMRVGLIPDFVKIMKATGVFRRDEFVGGNLYRFHNGSIIQFLGLDKEDVGKGVRSDVVFVNEANKCKFDEVREFTSRAKRVIFDYNPDFRFWIDEEFKGREGVEEIILTYKDNEELDENEVREIESYKERGFIDPDREDYDQEDNIKNTYWANKWRSRGLGQYGSVENAIYTDWRIGEFDELLPYWYGFDFGFSTSYDALVKIAINEKRRIIYAEEILYQRGLSQDALKQILRTRVRPTDLIVADNEEARLVSDLAKEFNVKPVKKWRVVERIKYVQSYTLVVTGKSLNLQRELENYVWSDKRAEVPVKENDHLLDALGYAVTHNKSAFQPQDVRYLEKLIY